MELNLNLPILQTMIYPEILLEKRNEHGRLLFFVKAEVERFELGVDPNEEFHVLSWEVTSNLPLYALGEEVFQYVRRIRGEEQELSLNEELTNEDESVLLPTEEVKRLLTGLVEVIHDNKKFHPLFLPDFLIDPLGNFKDLYLQDELTPKIRAKQGVSEHSLSIEEIAEYIIEEEVQKYPLILNQDDPDVDWAKSVISFFGLGSKNILFMETTAKGILHRVKDQECIDFLLDNPHLRYAVIFQTEKDDNESLLSDSNGFPVEMNFIIIVQGGEGDEEIVGFLRNEKAQDN